MSSGFKPLHATLALTLLLLTASPAFARRDEDPIHDNMVRAMENVESTLSPKVEGNDPHRKSLRQVGKEFWEWLRS